VGGRRAAVLRNQPVSLSSPNSSPSGLTAFGDAIARRIEHGRHSLARDIGHHQSQFPVRVGEEVVVVATDRAAWRL
jgi:hypothetical protein